MVFEGFSHFCVWENYFPNAPILPPKVAPKSPKNLKKLFLKTHRFFMLIFTDLGWILEPKIIPKWGPGHPQLSPGHSRSASWTPLEPKSLPKQNCLWFRLHLGSILEGFWHQNERQSASKTYKICFLASHTLSSSSKIQPPSRKPPNGLGGMREA